MPKNERKSGVVDGEVNGKDAPQPESNESNDQKTETVSKSIRMAMEALTLAAGASFGKGAKTPEAAMRKNYQFWSTQPVPKLSENVQENAPIESDKKPHEIRTEPYPLPDGYRWDALNIDDKDILKELYMLLYKNYVEDDDEMFRFDYQPEFLQWALKPPGWIQDWHIGVRVSSSNVLVAFISAIPATIRIQDKIRKMVEINFLCVHKKLRSKRLAPLLISEITRRVNLQGIFQAVYTAGVILPKPIVTCRYWHRSLNPKKLIDVKFSHLTRNMTVQRLVKLYKLPDTVKNAGFRPMTVDDLQQTRNLLNKYLEKFAVVPVFNADEFEHWFSPRENIINSYVICNDANDKSRVTDFISFYTLPSTVVQHPVHKSLKIAYSFYNVAETLTWPELMTDALITAKNNQFDAFNALDLMDNAQFLQELKFGIGDGFLQYYLFNWKCPALDPNQIGLILQ